MSSIDNVAQKYRSLCLSGIAEHLEQCNGQLKQDTFLSSLLIEFPLKFQRGLVA